MKQCCETMKEMMGYKGLRGLSVEYSDDPTEGVWQNIPVLVFRAVDDIGEDKLQISSNVPLSISGKGAFKFCPWCGTRVSTK